VERDLPQLMLPLHQVSEQQRY